jgi:hypothetical protein
MVTISIDFRNRSAWRCVDYEVNIGTDFITNFFVCTCRMCRPQDICILLCELSEVLRKKLGNGADHETDQNAEGKSTRTFFL